MNKTLKEITSELESHSIDVLHSDNYVVMSLTGTLDSIVVILNIINSLAKLKQKHIFLSCAYTKGETETSNYDVAIGNISKIVTVLNSNQKKFALVRASQKFSSAVTQKLGDTVRCYQTLPEALSALNQAVDPHEELKLFSDSVCEVFKTQFGLTVTPKPPEVNTSNESFNSRLVIGLIPLVSETSAGNLFLFFQPETIIELGLRTFGTKRDLPDPELMQIVGELANMVLGCCKEELNKRGYGIAQALPQMFYSTVDHPVMLKSSRKRWKIDFSSQVGDFSLELILQSSS